MPEQALLSVFLEQQLCDQVTDTLIASEHCNGFTLSPVQGYSKHHAQDDLKEQIAGYRHIFRLDILHSPEEQHHVLSLLASVGSQHPMRYWITPVLQHGTVS